MLERLKTFIPSNPLPAIGESIANKINNTPYLGTTVSYMGTTVSYMGKTVSSIRKAGSSISNTVAVTGSAINQVAKTYAKTCETTADLALKVANAVENTVDLTGAVAKAIVAPIAHPINTMLWCHGVNNVREAYDAFQLKDQEVPLEGTDLNHIIEDERAFSKRLQDAAPHLYLGASKAALIATLEFGTISNAFINQPMCRSFEPGNIEAWDQHPRQLADYIWPKGSELEPGNLETAFNVWHEHSRELADYAWAKGSETVSKALPVIIDGVKDAASTVYAQSCYLYANTTKQDVFDGLAKSFSNTQLGLQIGGTVLGVAGFSYLSAYNFTKCAEAVETRSPLAFVKHGALSAIALTAAVATPFLLGADKLAFNSYEASNIGGAAADTPPFPLATAST